MRQADILARLADLQLGMGDREAEAFRSWWSSLSPDGLEKAYQSLTLFCVAEMGVKPEWILEEWQEGRISASYEEREAEQAMLIYLLALWKTSLVGSCLATYQKAEDLLKGADQHEPQG